MGVAPLVVLGRPPSATWLTNSQVRALSVLAYRSMRVPLLLQLLPDARMVPGLKPPRGSRSSIRAGCAPMPQPLTWSVRFEIHFQLSPPSLLSKMGNDGRSPSLPNPLPTLAVTRIVPSLSSATRGYTARD